MHHHQWGVWRVRGRSKVGSADRSLTNYERLALNDGVAFGPLLPTGSAI